MSHTVASYSGASRRESKGGGENKQTNCYAISRIGRTWLRIEGVPLAVRPARHICEFDNCSVGHLLIQCELIICDNKSRLIV